MRFCLTLGTLLLLPFAGCNTGLNGKTFDGAGGAAGSTSSVGLGGGGASSASTSATATTGTGGAGGNSDCAYDDELNDQAVFDDCWTNRAVAEGGPAGLTYAIDTADAGHLIARPDTGVGFWQNQPGPYFYKLVTGDFVVVSYVSAHHISDEDLAPTVDYNLAGLVVREPLTNSLENWVKYETGYLTDFAGGVGSLVGATTDSTSNHLLPYSSDGYFRRRLAICRSGATIHFISSLSDQGPWTITDVERSAVQGLEAPSFSSTVQVGMTISGFAGQTPPNVEASFDYVRFSIQTMRTVNDCLTALSVIAP